MISWISRARFSASNPAKRTRGGATTLSHRRTLYSGERLKARYGVTTQSEQQVGESPTMLPRSVHCSALRLVLQRELSTH